MTEIVGELLGERFARVVHGVVTHRADTAAALAEVLDATPEHTLAHCVRGFATLGLGRRALLRDAADALARAHASMNVGDPTEVALVAALAAWVAGEPPTAAAILGQALRDRPHDLLLMKLEHGCRFMLGDVEGMRASAEVVLPHWEIGRPGYGYVLGMASFAAVEAGDFTRSQAYGERAVELTEDDAWGAHAVGHVFEMQDDPARGRAWLRACRDANTFSSCSNFAGHVAWHLALFELALDDAHEALRLLDDEILPYPPGNFRDVSNASSLLHRLEGAGVDVRERWRSLRERIRPYLSDHGYAFADAHYALVLAACRSDDGLSLAHLESLRRDSLSHTDHAARVQRKVGRRLAEGIRALYEPDAERAFEQLARASRGTQQIGGSGAQREVFRRLFVDAAHATGRSAAIDEAITSYLRARPKSGWALEGRARSPERATRTLQLSQGQVGQPSAPKIAVHPTHEISVVGQALNTAQPR